MNEIPNCYCGSDKEFADCCKPLHEEKSFAQTAEILMRSRYSAYACGNIDYILDTTHISQRKYYSRKEIKKWAEESEWLKLEILFSSETTVEFKAFYRDKNSILQVHHEKSTFKMEAGKWYFVEGN